MSDQIKLLYQARTMRNFARQSRSVAQQLSEASYRQFVLDYAEMVELQADDLERFALENMKALPTVSLQKSDRDAEGAREIAATN
jgi:hypothetical protein